MQIQSVGIDLGKTTFHLVALGAAGKVIVRKKFNRKQLLAYTSNVPASLIGLEACSGAHFLGRALRKQGHDVSKRGNVYLRKILIHGARAAVLRIKRHRAPMGPWLDALDARAPKMLLWSRWQTSSRGSHGLCCRAEKTTGQWGILLPHEIVRKRRLRLGSADALSLSRTTTTD
jgi:hypothetical protein